MTRRRLPPWRPSRRSFLASLGGSAAALAGRPPRLAHASGTADHIVFFYFPDGVAGWSQSGDASLWHCTGGETDFTLGHTLQALAPFRDRCQFFNGLSMGSTDDGSHPGAAKKLLTAADYGNNESIDQYLSRTIGTDRPWHHLYLGAQAGADGATGDKFITYPVAGSTMAPEDDPRRAFAALFGTDSAPAEDPDTEADTPTEPDAATARRQSVLDAAMDEIHALQAQLGATEREKLDLHLTSLRELEGRLAPTGGGSSGSSDWEGCESPDIDVGGLTDANLYDPSLFPPYSMPRSTLVATWASPVGTSAANTSGLHEPLSWHRDVRPQLRHAQPSGEPLRLEPRLVQPHLRGLRTTAPVLGGPIRAPAHPNGCHPGAHR